MAFPLLLACVALAAGCASGPAREPLTGAGIVALARDGKSAAQIIEELERTGTVLPLQASDIVALHESGVPDEVLDYLQRAQIDDIRWRDRYWRRHDPFERAFGPCLWPGLRRPLRGGPWGC